MRAMRAWRVPGSGEPEQMTIDNVPLPDPGPRQVRIRVRNAGINFFDLLQVRGLYQEKPVFPFTPGAEVAGNIDACGAEVYGFEHGDSVQALCLNSGFAEYVLAPVSNVFPMPCALSFDEAAAMPVVYHTSWFALTRRAHLAAGEHLLVHAGASGVGMSAIQIGVALGAKVIATAGSAAKREFCLKQGAAHAIDYSDASWVEQVKHLTEGRGADVIYDPVGGDVFDLSLKCVAIGGRILVIGFAGGRIPTVAANKLLLRNISVVGAIWGNYVRAHPEYLSEAQLALTKLVAAGKIRPALSHVYPFEQLPQALRDVADRKVIGKAVLVIE